MEGATKRTSAHAERTNSHVLRLTSPHLTSESSAPSFPPHSQTPTAPRSTRNMASSKAPAGHFTVLYFAAASTFTGKATEHLPAPLRVRNLFAKLNDTYPGFKEQVLSSCAVSVNLDYVDLDDDDVSGADKEINAGDEVAIIPPVSSG